MPCLLDTVDEVGDVGRAPLDPIGVALGRRDAGDGRARPGRPRVEPRGERTAAGAEHRPGDVVVVDAEADVLERLAPERAGELQRAAGAEERLGVRARPVNGQAAAGYRRTAARRPGGGGPADRQAGAGELGADGRHEQELAVAGLADVRGRIGRASAEVGCGGVRDRPATAVTVIVTVAGALWVGPSLAAYVNESDPLKPAAGV